MTAPGAGFDPDQPYELDPAVALRPEPFGALAYHYGNRRLNFVRSGELVELLGRLGAHRSATSAMEAAGIAEERRATFVAALAALQRSEVIRAR
ncbi:MAG TPA: mycofactocin biosynthesis chaperone MftB [Acidimicrobiales bacterium]|nr:mycofactocin biosynthesis chaperone MftB [Acidimicrobiales bacterium]